MPVYEYQARTVNGSVVKGKMEAVDEAMVVASLRGKEYYPVSIKVFNDATNIDFTKFKKVKTKDISIFCRQFSFSISAGISILKAIEVVKEQTENKKLKNILDDVFEELQKGKALSEAFSEHKEIPEMLIHMIEVGEASGSLDKIMERMADYYEKENMLNQKIKQALTYPILVSVFAIAVVILLVTVVLPQFITTLQSFGGELPLPTRIVMGLSNAIKTKGVFMLIGIILIVEAIRMYNRSNSGQETLHRFKLKMPIFGKMNKKIVTAKFARTFGILMSSGMPLMQSLSICSKVVGNRVVTDVLQKAQDDIKKGGSLSAALSESGLFPPMLTQMIKIGEESGTLDGTLNKTAEYYDNEVDVATAQLTTMIEPLIIILLSVVVGFIILSVIMPMFSMYNSIG